MFYSFLTCKPFLLCETTWARKDFSLCQGKVSFLSWRKEKFDFMFTNAGKTLSVVGKMRELCSETEKRNLLGYLPLILTCNLQHCSDLTDEPFLQKCSDPIFIKMKSCRSHRCSSLCILLSSDTDYITQYQAGIIISF